ncbi:GAF domain-containing protein [Exiguobacterium sp. AM39-5BH]|uniref:sensor domain-containing diguanylate cyclase n=1 Tax=Exiguobacterium sp. AM39-5BH TaxID=2292355 RepID=UPI001F2367F9|nr:GAF domain-containing protein [Exiguobacterium sp. AM39-5BH]
MNEGSTSSQIYRKHQEKLFELVRIPEVTEEAVRQTLHYMCEVVSDMLNVDTVSIWHFDETYTSISCQVAYSKANGPSEPVLTVVREDAPVYFEALCTNRVLPFENVRTHEWVKELYQQHFVEGQRVYSMLDAPIFANNQAKGVICCETYAPRQWTFIEELIVSTLSDFIAILYHRLDRQAIDEHITRLAYTDEQTGLMNLNSFIERVDVLREQTPHQLGSLIYMRADEFRSVETAIGIQRADDIVVELSERLRQIVDPSLLARVSQSGFLLWTPYGDRIKVKALADLICETVTNEPFAVGEIDVVLTMSAFISIEDKSRSTLEMIDTTRITANERHVPRGGIAFYEEEMGEKATARLTLEMDLEKGSL